MLHILIADDHGIVRAGLRMLLDRQDGMNVIAEAQDGVDAVLGLRDHVHPVLAVEQHAQPGPDDAVVVGDQDVEHARLIGGCIA